MLRRLTETDRTFATRASIKANIAAAIVATSTTIDQTIDAGEVLYLKRLREQLRTLRDGLDERESKEGTR